MSEPLTDAELHALEHNIARVARGPEACSPDLFTYEAFLRTLLLAPVPRLVAEVRRLRKELADLLCDCGRGALRGGCGICDNDE